MPKQNPYLIKENYKKIEEVREIENEIKTSRLSPAARSKIVKRHGSDYVSENGEFYGPGSAQSSYSDNSEEARMNRYAAKTTTNVGVAVISKAAGPVGALASGVAGAVATTVGEIGYALSSSDGAKDT